MPAPILLVILDGLGDRPCGGLKGMTPLQAARRPALNALARGGSSGLLHPIGPGIPPGSDTSHLALLGYDPYEVYTGRGPFEAMGAGLDVKPGEVALRCNFATVDESLTIVDRRAERIRQGTAELAKALDNFTAEGVRMRFREATEHRAVLLLTGAGLSPKISDCDPHEAGQRVRDALAIEKSEAAARAAAAVNAFVRRSFEVLREHPVNIGRIRAGRRPANIVLPRGAGQAPVLEPFHGRYGVKGCAVAGVAMIKGIARLAGLELLDVKGATGGLDTDMGAKGAAAADALGKTGFVLLHVKATDIAGHDGDAPKKVEMIRRADGMVASLRRSAPADTVIAVTGDHSTPVEVGEHTADPVPLVVYSRGARADGVKRFDEISCACGALGRLRGKELMPVLMGLAGRAEKFGA